MADESLDASKRVGPLAIVAFLASVASALALLTPVFAIISLLAFVLGVFAFLQTQKDSEVGGSGLAQAAIVLAALTATWSLTANWLHQKYLFEQAGEVAAQYLELLSDGNKYQAHELRLPESQRQLTGTNIQVVYESAPQAIEAIVGLEKEPATQHVLGAGPSSTWGFVRGVEIAEKPPVAVVKIEMTNTAEASGKTVLVTVVRDRGLIVGGSGPPKACWHVAGADLVN